MRMIDQLARLLTKILFNKETKNYAEAFAEIDRAFSGIVGLDHNLIKNFSSGDIIRLLEFSDKETVRAKCIVTAKLLKERADLKFMINNDDPDISGEYIKALDLFLNSILVNQGKMIELDSYYSDVREITGKLHDSELSEDLKNKLKQFDQLTESNS